jgi:hypothetical protein
VDGDGEAPGLVRICTFHPAYGYEDFLEGYRPVRGAEGQLAFERRDGIFNRLCADAARDAKHHYYLLIGEIDRGDIPRIFGELLTLLEKEKRGHPVHLPLSGEVFSVPDNVHVELGKQEDLISALLAPTPELTTTTAVTAQAAPKDTGGEAGAGGRGRRRGERRSRRRGGCRRRSERVRHPD